MSMWVIAAALGGWFYVQLGGTPGEVSRWGNLLPLVLAVTSDALVNIALLIGVISTANRPARYPNLATGFPMGAADCDFGWHPGRRWLSIGL